MMSHRHGGRVITDCPQDRVSPKTKETICKKSSSESKWQFPLVWAHFASIQLRWRVCQLVVCQRKRRASPCCRAETKIHHTGVSEFRDEIVQNGPLLHTRNEANNTLSSLFMHKQSSEPPSKVYLHSPKPWKRQTFGWINTSFNLRRTFI